MIPSRPLLGLRFFKYAAVDRASAQNLCDKLASISISIERTISISVLFSLSATPKQKEIYDKKHCTNPEVYSVGALVLKKDFTRKKRKGGKLDSKWLGPFRITKVLGKGLYSLESFDEPMEFT